MRRSQAGLTLVLLGALAGCSADDPGARPTGSSAPPEASAAPTVGSGSTTTSTTASTPSSSTPSGDAIDGPTASDRATVTLRLGEVRPDRAIDPRLVGISQGLTVDQMRDVGVALNSWGGNPSTRYNYLDGAAWNNARDYEYRNTSYGLSGDQFRRVAAETAEAGAALRLAVPTLGWIARDASESTCSFPTDDGGCSDAGGADCADPGSIADPGRTSIPSTAPMVADWVGGLLADGVALDYVAMDNEPELWGSTHYDVHPECPTYEELLNTYLQYATAIRAVAPDVALAGPAMCCWYDWWDTAPGPADGSGEDYLTWFLREVREHDVATGVRTLDVVDLHYYPQSEVFNEDTDPETNARRLRSTRSLWDPSYVDESWIGEAIEFLPRVRASIEATYPGTPIVISEWNFGADTSMNGALAIADVLGIFGREGVQAAAYWRSPPANSPGYFAFKLHGNYDSAGSRFTGVVVPLDLAVEADVAAFAALDPTSGAVKLMLFNRELEDAVDVTVSGADGLRADRRFTYGPDDLGAIVAGVVDDGAITLAPSSITVVELVPN